MAGVVYPAYYFKRIRNKQEPHTVLLISYRISSKNRFNPIRISQEETFCESFTLKALITTAADNIHKYFFHFFSEKIRLDVSSEFSARQRIHMKDQALFSSKDENKK